LGIKYNYANCDPKNGFDCSGFVYYVFSHFNVKVPRSSSEYKNFGRKIPFDSAQIGDVIVFTGTNAKDRSPGHLGIVVSKPNEELSFIHSSSDKKTPGVKISMYTASNNYKKRFIKVVRVAQVK
jgi:cell wall-associated NlpC family hydrolase